MRIGLLGGSFDPPHVGHLLAASDAFESLGLDRLIFVPAAVQPFKAGQAGATPEQRLAMVRLLAANDRRFEVSAIEIDRGGLSYTVDTLSAVAAQWPAAELFLLVGADVPASFANWREPDRIAQLATLVVLERSGEAPELGGLPGTWRALPTRRIDISSTEVRRRVREGKSIRGFVPDAVADFVAAERLYR
ncbi:MAG TPA: nicotinate-nucleotide adenylyltransferase [Gemmatimonadaceae bacterium]|nr:nicotinate-nucleotide adenylyltransferase [Gemmatimonadaceae bacterium]